MRLLFIFPRIEYLQYFGPFDFADFVFAVCFDSFDFADSVIVVYFDLQGS